MAAGDSADSDSDESPPKLYVNSINVRSSTSSPTPQEAAWSSGRSQPAAIQRKTSSRASRRRIVEKSNPMAPAFPS
ncbi:unnamed protein product [Dibothriocephalus latus]|uniref:Uncharacterized protein n=1 Tax=Dibothriocephalus latus TaxID=60516 RepID=A0A3P6R744_DIBLA|nr:unnamed protein product [Dibothriocephalus latus]